MGNVSTRRLAWFLGTQTTFILYALGALQAHSHYRELHQVYIRTQVILKFSLTSVHGSARQRDTNDEQPHLQFKAFCFCFSESLLLQVAPGGKGGREDVKREECTATPTPF